MAELNMANEVETGFMRLGLGKYNTKPSCSLK